MTPYRPRTHTAASLQARPRAWALLTLTWLVWLALQMMVMAAPGRVPQAQGTSAANTTATVWDPARRPIEGWGTSAPAAGPAVAPAAPVATPAPAKTIATPKAPGRTASTVAHTAPAVKAVAARHVSGVRLTYESDTPVAKPAVSSSNTAATPATPEGAPAATPEPQPQPDTREAAPAKAAPAAAAAAPPKPVEKKPAPTGLERLSDDWPAWVKPSFQYRGRVESSRGLLSHADYDGYYLNRVRFGATLGTSPWFQAVFQFQDSQVLEYAVAPVPRNMANTVDMRIGYVAFGSTKGGPLAVRIGRQDMAFGEGRLLASPDWGNTNRTYDAVRTTSTGKGFKFDTFAGAPVEVKQGGFDPRKPGENFYGFYASFDKLIAGVIEPFAVVRTTHVTVSELGRAGDGLLYTVGGRVAGKSKVGVDYAADLVVQRGDMAGDPVSAWATHLAVSRTLSQTTWKPRVVVEYNFASGDDNAKDGRRGTFDQLYASNHARYGQADLIGWRNMHHAGMTVEFAPAKPLKVTTGVHRFFLASLGDGLYGASGSRTVFAKTATSRDIGWEADLGLTYAVSKELSVGAGLGTLFTGKYLEQAGAPSTFFSPYLLWTTKF